MTPENNSTLSMTLEYSIKHEQSLIKVRAHGTGDYLSVHQLWQDIAVACKKYSCQKILGEAHIDAPNPIDGAYDHAAIFEAASMTAEYRIAWVENNPEAKEPARLVEAVLRNRGLAVARVFDNIREAQRWLEEKP
ncbi:MAG: hypothetical protein ACR2QI_04870 [Woeseiaceae bacterium]